MVLILVLILVTPTPCFYAHLFAIVHEFSLPELDRGVLRPLYPAQ